MLSSIIGAAIGSAIDGADGDDSTLDGAIGGALAGALIRGLAPVVMTYAVGWLVLHGIGKAKDAMGDAVFQKGTKA
ncbi:hypothetical protein M0208_14070 [Sphingomonas sp. SUN019]|uniref:hypothetical protein n=1 Tax=Sphingomonas sp. SUN019 TaxID=2937788 RepID=UPI002164D1A6|nr:hypothetical protein [Sphingomonas sp. SUN019]UVO51574.1 hypothetical protein M0208_14070 [Sphingomonas sp. SUN019]